MSTFTKTDNSPTENSVALRIQTLGGFKVWREGVEIPAGNWKREKALHLFQFIITMRRQASRLHKEQIINRLWPDLNFEEGDRDFKVAMHTLNKVLEPERKPRSEAQFMQRFDLTYGLNLNLVWIDADAFETLITNGNRSLPDDVDSAIKYYQRALDMYQGDFLPERRYEDWSSFERERLQVLALGLMTTLAELMLDRSPLESIRLTQYALTIDPVWENAYRIQMTAYAAQGNRPLAIKTYRQCQQALADELGIDPLPETQAMYQQILNQV